MPVQDNEYVFMEDGKSIEESPVEDGESTAQGGKTELCRDFKKGVCRRGEKCIYDHPKLDVCRDYQNGRCVRATCKYMHIARQEEEAYVKSGILPSQGNTGLTMKNVMNTMAIGGGLGLDRILGTSNLGIPGISPAPMTTQEICRDFEKGDCRRGTRCKFYHPKLKICRDFQNNKCERDNCRFLHITREDEESYEGSGVIPDHLDEEEVKKKRILSPPSVGAGAGGMSDLYGKRTRVDNIDSMVGASSASYMAILQENQTLKLKITEMQQQITDLRKMNDTLYDQNSIYRNERRGAFGGL